MGFGRFAPYKSFFYGPQPLAWNESFGIGRGAFGRAAIQGIGALGRPLQLQSRKQYLLQSHDKIPEEDFLEFRRGLLEISDSDHPSELRSVRQTGGVSIEEGGDHQRCIKVGRSTSAPSEELVISRGFKEACPMSGSCPERDPDLITGTLLVRARKVLY